MKIQSAAARVIVCGIAILMSAVIPWFPSARAAGTAAKPNWAPGDFWEYRASQTIVGGTFTYVDRVEVKDLENITVGADTWSAYNATETDTDTGPLGSSTICVRSWYRTTDLALIQVSACDLSFVSNTDPPQEIRWPLVVGASWNGTATQTNNFSGSVRVFPITYNTTVEDGGVHATPAGTFDTLLVRTSTSSPNRTSEDLMYYSASVGNRVLLKGGSTPDLLLTSFRFQQAPATPENILAWASIALVVALVVTAVVWYSRRRLHPRSGAPVGSRTEDGGRIETGSDRKP